MKKLVFAATAASVALMSAVPAAAAPFGHNDRGYNDRGRYEQVRHDNRGQLRSKARYAKAHKWNKGQRFDRRHVRSYRIIDNPRAYRLRDAPRGYRWVQSDNDAVLVAITSGVIGAVLANIFD